MSRKLYELVSLLLWRTVTLFLFSFSPLARQLSLQYMSREIEI